MCYIICCTVVSLWTLTLMILLFVFRISLTSSQSQTRGRGVQLLSEVLQECYSGLSEREVEVLIAFYENRLKDHYAITPHVLRGLKALSTVLPPGSAVSILRSLFQDVNVQSLMLELKGLGPDFVFGFVQAVDGERDPRNLLLAFQIARNIIHRGYDLSQFTEEFFEVTSCYFPIDFTPPPNDAHGITQEELILALRGVLTGTPRIKVLLSDFLLFLCFNAGLKSSDHSSALTQEAVLSAVVPVISTACAALQTDLAAKMAAQVVSLFLDGDVSFLPDNAYPSQIQLLKVRIQLLEELSCSCSHAFSYTSAAKCFAGLINKRAAGKHISLFIFSLLSDPQLGSQAADSFSLLMSDSPDVLNRSCHADVRIMYRQRFFAENSAKLVQGFNCAEQESKSVYLKALSHIVNNLPRQVQLSELPALLPLLLEALSCPDQAVQLSTLSCLQPVLLDPPPALTTQLEALFSRLLALTSSPAMKVRMAALRCVHALSRLPEHMVLPFRARVLRALAPPLDDKKRLVRKEAVSARGEWFLLGSPGGR
uniref:MMS19 nucleotide excision repair protein n=1 Tax=Astyanax mexicanus TaxID=7994 RepID=A0A8B9HN32_ASTMX